MRSLAPCATKRMAGAKVVKDGIVLNFDLQTAVADPPADDRLAAIVQLAQHFDPQRRGTDCATCCVSWHRRDSILLMHALSMMWHAF